MSRPTIPAPAVQAVRDEGERWGQQPPMSESLTEVLIRAFIAEMNKLGYFFVRAEDWRL